MGKVTVALNAVLKCFFLLSIVFSFMFVTHIGVLWAGGLYIQEFGTPSMGVASAGAEAVCMDASTSWHNAAGMTRLEGNELMLAGGLLYSSVKFDPASNTPVDGGDGRVEPIASDLDVTIRDARKLVQNIDNQIEPLVSSIKNTADAATIAVTQAV